MKAKFYRCNHCGNIAVKLQDQNVPLVCCGEEMQEMKANTTDAAVEKHVPEVKVSGSDIHVTVGSTVHPMTEEHYIQWIYLETEKGGQFKKLTPSDEPKAVFSVKDEKAVAVYEYCNLHGLWKKEI